ncbi:MAG: hypothetical protein ACKO90_36740, partial [Microcystis panniformis]
TKFLDLFSQPQLFPYCLLLGTKDDFATEKFQLWPEIGYGNLRKRSGNSHREDPDPNQGVTV